MNKINRTGFYLLTILLLLICGSCSRKKEIDFKSRVCAGSPIPDGVMDTLLNQYRVPAISIATIDEGKIDWVKAYGLRKFGSPDKVDSLTLFQAASISKPVSAVVALRMVDMGELSLDEDVNNRLKAWKIPINEFTKNQPITLRHLLSHSAGLTMHGVPEFEANAEIPSLIQILDGNWYGARESVCPVIEPGKEYRYSGGGDIILQLFLTDISNRSFEDLVQELVLDPARMTSSTFDQPLPEERWDIAAVGHHWDRTPMKGFWHTLPEQATG